MTSIRTIAETATGILNAMRFAYPRPWDTPPRKRPLGAAAPRPTGRRRQRRKASLQVKALKRLGYPSYRISKISEEEAVGIVRRGEPYERKRKRAIA